MRFLLLVSLLLSTNIVLANCPELYGSYTLNIISEDRLSPSKTTSKEFSVFVSYLPESTENRKEYTIFNKFNLLEQVAFAHIRLFPHDNTCDGVINDTWSDFSIKRRSFFKTREVIDGDLYEIISFQKLLYGFNKPQFDLYRFKKKIHNQL